MVTVKGICNGFLLFIFTIFSIEVKGSTYTSDSNLEKLLAMENDLIQISNYLLRQEQAIHGDHDIHQLGTINSTIESSKEIHKQIGRQTSAYLSHPFNVYHLMKRLHERWSKTVQTIIDSDYCQEALEIRLNNVLENIPTEDIVREAASGIVNLQYLHGLEMDDLSRGTVNGVEPLEAVTADEVFDIGKVAYDNEDYFNAILWFEKAAEIFKSLPANETADAGFNETNTLNIIASSYYKLRRLSKAVKILDQLLLKDPGNTRVKKTKKYYEDRIKHYGDISDPPKRRMPRDKDQRLYERLCRGEQLKTAAQESRLNCFYQKTWKKFIFAKAEVKNLSPMVLVLHDIADNDTTLAIKYMGYEQMTKTALGNEFRHSYPSVTVVDQTSWKWLKRVEKKYNELEGLLYSPLQQSLFQVRNYGMDGTLEKPIQPLTSYSQGGEVGNFVLFLTDVPAGGQLVLPRVKTRIITERGSVVFWYATQAYAAFCPTSQGSQWVAWKTYYEQPAWYCRLTEAPKYSDGH